jgi:hypothetical protein
MSIRGVGAVRVFTLLGVLLASGCGERFVYTPLKRPSRPMMRHPAEAVELLVVTPPSRPHTDIGLIQAFPGIGGETIPELIRGLRARAGVIGCDAILITSVDRQTTRYHSESVQASCVVYDDAAPICPSCR